jgi:hypothetical protein
MTEFVLPGHYKLIAATVITHAGIEIPFTGLIPVFSIEQSLDTDSIRGNATVIDNIGYLESIPLRGEETIIFEVEDALSKRTTYEMSIYKISDIEIKKTNDGLTYKIHFVSRSSFLAGFRRIIEPYNDKISNIVEQVFTKYYPEGSKELLLEETVGLFRCVIPNYTPMQSMNFLANRSYSTNSPSCSFRFFETTDNYFFVSDEYLIKRFLENKEAIKEFTYSDAIDKSGADFLAQMRNLIEIKNSDRINTIMDLTSGAYRSNVIEIDINKRQVTLPGKSNKHEYNYQEAKTRYMSSSGRGEGEDVHTPEFANEFFTTENEKRYIVIRDYDDSGTLQLRGDQFIPEIATNRLAYRQHLNTTTIFAKAHGRLDLNVGDVINLKVSNFSIGDKSEYNKQLSGYYLINNLIHTFTRDIHETSLKIVKYDWDTAE